MYTTTDKYGFKFTSFCNHNVVIMTVANPKDIGGNTVACTGVHEALHSLLKLKTDMRTHSGFKKCLLALHTIFSNAWC